MIYILEFITDDSWSSYAVMNQTTGYEHSRWKTYSEAIKVIFDLNRKAFK